MLPGLYELAKDVSVPKISLHFNKYKLLVVGRAVRSLPGSLASMNVKKSTFSAT